MINFEFKIHYRKDNENDDADALSQQSDYKKVKIIHKKFFRKNSKRILTKNLVTTHYIESVSQNNDDVIRECHKTKVSEHLKVRRTENLV